MRAGPRVSPEPRPCLARCRGCQAGPSTPGLVQLPVPLASQPCPEPRGAATLGAARPAARALAEGLWACSRSAPAPFLSCCLALGGAQAPGCSQRCPGSGGTAPALTLARLPAWAGVGSSSPVCICVRNGIYPLMNFAVTRPLALPRALSQPQEDPQKTKTPTPEPFDVETRKVRTGQRLLLPLGEAPSRPRPGDRSPPGLLGLPSGRGGGSPSSGQTGSSRPGSGSGSARFPAGLCTLEAGVRLMPERLQGGSDPHLAPRLRQCPETTAALGPLGAGCAQRARDSPAQALQPEWGQSWWVEGARRCGVTDPHHLFRGVTGVSTRRDC